MVIFGKFSTVSTFDTPVAFGTLRIGPVLSTLGIISSKFWYIWCTMVHLTLGTLVSSLQQLIHQVVFWHTRIVLVHLVHYGTLDVRYIG